MHVRGFHQQQKARQGYLRSLIGITRSAFHRPHFFALQVRELFKLYDTAGAGELDKGQFIDVLVNATGDGRCGGAMHSVCSAV